LQQLERIRCTKCGADFENYDPDARVMRCNRAGCGASFVIAQAEKFAKVQVDHQESITKLRGLLQSAIKDKDALQMAEYAKEIRILIPDDALAAYCEALGQKKRGRTSNYASHLQTTGSMTLEEAEEILKLALSEHFFTMHDKNALKTFIAAQFPDNMQKEKLRQLDVAVNHLAEAVNRYAIIPRDVFICHSSDDAIAKEVDEMLRADGVKCWISSRNLPPDTIHYWDFIHKALDNCKIILVIASQSSMLKDDPVREMQYARSKNLKRLEFKIDNYPHTQFFRHFFDGISWVSLGEDKEAAFQALKRRIYLLLHEDEAEPEQSLQPVAPAQHQQPGTPMPGQQRAIDTIPVQVSYAIAQNGEELYSETLYLQDGQHTIRPNPRFVPQGMIVSGKKQHEVTVKDDRADPVFMVFQLSRIADTAKVTILYKRKDNNQLVVKESRLMTTADAVIKPDLSLVPENMSLDESQQHEVRWENGKPKDSTYTFLMAPAVKDKLLNIRYLDQHTKKVLKTEKRLLSSGKHTITPNKDLVPAGYQPIQQEQIIVHVDSKKVIPETVSFLCKETPKKTKVTLQYKDKQERTLARDSVLFLEPGSHKIKPDPKPYPNDYRLVSKEVISLVTSENSKDNTFTYYYKPLRKRASFFKTIFSLLAMLIIIAWAVASVSFVISRIDFSTVLGPIGVQVTKTAVGLRFTAMELYSFLPLKQIQDFLPLQVHQLDIIIGFHFLVVPIILMMISRMAGLKHLKSSVRIMRLTNNILWLIFVLNMLSIRAVGYNSLQGGWYFLAVCIAVPNLVYTRVFRSTNNKLKEQQV